jgi:hypothetical protein
MYSTFDDDILRACQARQLATKARISRRTIQISSTFNSLYNYLHTQSSLLILFFNQCCMRFRSRSNTSRERRSRRRREHKVRGKRIELARLYLATIFRGLPPHTQYRNNKSSWPSRSKDFSRQGHIQHKLP